MHHYTQYEQRILDTQRARTTLPAMIASLATAANRVQHALDDLRQREAEAMAVAHDIGSSSGLQHAYWSVADAQAALTALLAASNDASGCGCVEGRHEACGWCETYGDLHIDGRAVNRHARHWQGKV